MSTSANGRVQGSAAPTVPGEWREYIDIIHNEGKRLSRLIDDVLDLTRMEEIGIQQTAKGIFICIKK